MIELGKFAASDIDFASARASASVSTGWSLSSDWSSFSSNWGAIASKATPACFRRFFRVGLVEARMSNWFYILFGGLSC